MSCIHHGDEAGAALSPRYAYKNPWDVSAESDNIMHPDGWEKTSADLSCKYSLMPVCTDSAGVIEWDTIERRD